MATFKAVVVEKQNASRSLVTGAGSFIRHFGFRQQYFQKIKPDAAQQ
jgi:hypothetical protein